MAPYGAALNGSFCAMLAKCGAVGVQEACALRRRLRRRVQEALLRVTGALSARAEVRAARVWRALVAQRRRSAL